MAANGQRLKSCSGTRGTCQPSSKQTAEASGHCEFYLLIHAPELEEKGPCIQLILTTQPSVRPHLPRCNEWPLSSVLWLRWHCWGAVASFWLQYSNGHSWGHNGGQGFRAAGRWEGSGVQTAGLVRILSPRLEGRLLIAPAPRPLDKNITFQNPFTEKHLVLDCVLLRASQFLSSFDWNLTWVNFGSSCRLSPSTYGLFSHLPQPAPSLAMLQPYQG